LIDVTTQVLDSENSDHTKALGWFFDFDASGTNDEKVLSGARTIAGAVLFTTYEPEGGSTDPCSANVGGGNAYNFNILNTRAFLDWDTDGTLEDFADRKLTLGGGIPSDVVPIFTKEGVVGIVGVEGGAAQLGLLSGVPRVRTYWYQEL
jgi:type IV pilus assembly protein PilY1